MTALLLAAALLLAGDPPESYDDLVSRGVAEGREGRLVDAARDLDAAIARDGSRPEARVERGGLFFVQKQDHDAARELRKALRLRDDPYARDLLASSLYLAGHEDEALAEWNALGKPRVSRVEISGLVHALDRVARREVLPAEGDVLTLGAVAGDTDSDCGRWGSSTASPSVRRPSPTAERISMWLSSSATGCSRRRPKPWSLRAPMP